MSLPVLRIPEGAMLPDNAQWTNRFEIRSESSSRVYRIAQNKTGRWWGCSCPSWIYRGRECKHLRALSLPGKYQPYEVAIEGVDLKAVKGK